MCALISCFTCSISDDKAKSVTPRRPTSLPASVKCTGITNLLAGLLELIPWVKQWPNEPNDEYGGLRLGEYFETFLDAQCRDVGFTRDDLRA